LLLAYDIAVHELLHFSGSGKALGTVGLGVGGFVELFFQYGTAEIYAFVTDINTGTGKDPLNTILGFAAKGAANYFISQNDSPLFLLSLIDDLVNEAVFLGFLGSEEMISLAVTGNGLHILAGVLSQDGIEPLLHIQDTTGLDLDIRSLTLGTAQRLVDHDLGIGKGNALALGAGGQKEGTNRGSHTDADGGDITLDVFHGVINRHTCSYRATGAVDVELDVLVRVLCL
jgi:hypothetical protein